MACYVECMTVKRNVKKERDLSIRKMRAKGKTLEEIAQFFGISRQRVHQILKDV
jgi:DNA-directed RNA polymerase sigma subunit (sigma70/sigma32)